MNVLIVNPIVYTSETKQIHRAKTIKDTMIYDLCLAFDEMGHDITLYAAEPFKPDTIEDYPFKVIWGKCIGKKLFMPHCFPFMPDLYQYIKQNEHNLDLIICSEVFSMNTLISVQALKKKVIIWHELAKHNKMMKKIPSKIWYNVIAKLFMKDIKVVSRSKEARDFIKKYCRNTQDKIIDHGVNLNKFVPCEEKQDSFVVCSQLIPRKRIEGILEKFAEYLRRSNSNMILYIIGDGESKQSLIAMTKQLKIEKQVIFKGKMKHHELLPYLSTAKALLVNTEKDNNMISIVESIAVGTPIITTTIPLNASYIKANKLGIADNDWNADSLEEIVRNGAEYTKNCMKYRECLSTKNKVKQFENLL